MEANQLFDKVGRTLDSGADALQIWSDVIKDSMAAEEGEYTPDCQERMARVAERMDEVVKEMRALWNEVVATEAENGRRGQA